MGWTISYDKTRSEMIAERTRSTTQADGTRWECLRHTAVGNVLWVVWEVTPGEPVPPRAFRPPYRFIGCDLLAPGGKGWGWGYKDMCESMGPCYYTCPLAYLELVPVVANAEWRESVREYHSARNRKVNVGDRLVFKGLSIPDVEIVEKVGRRLVGVHAGCRYRISPKVLAHVVEQHAR